MKRLLAALLAVVLLPTLAMWASAGPPYVGGIPYSPASMLVQLGSGTNTSLVTPRPTRIVLSGDSGIAGITNTKPGGPPGLQGELSQRLRFAGDDFTFQGLYLVRPGDNVAAQPSRYNFPIEPWNEGVSGNKIEQITARIPTEVPQFVGGLPDVIIDAVGINNICGGDTAAQMLVKLATEHAAWRAAAPQALIVHATLGLPPAASGCNGITGDPIRASFNTSLLATGPGSWIAGLNDPNAFVIDIASDFTGADQGWLSGPVRDSHYDDWGYTIAAQRIADFLIARKPVRSGLPFPRPIRRSQQQPSVRLVASTDAVQFTLPTAFGSASWAFGFDVQLSMLPANGSFLSLGGYGWQYDSPSNGGVGVFVVGDTSTGYSYGDIRVYQGAGGPVIVAYNVLDVGTTHRIVVSFHSSENIMALWVDGVLVSAYAHTAVTLGGTQEFILGNTAYFRTAPGIYDRLEVLASSAVPMFGTGAMRKAVEANWFETKLLHASASFPTGSTAFYVLNDGSGTAPLEASLGTAGCLGTVVADVCTAGAGSATWLPAGIALRYDGRTGEQRDWGSWQTPPPRTLFQWAASASLTTAAAQYVPPGSGAATTTTDTVLGVLASGFAMPISRLAYQFTGSSNNVAGQTISVILYQNGTAIPGATATGIATTAGNQTGTVTFSPVVTFPKDVITASVTPSASLTTALADVMISANSVAGHRPANDNAIGLFAAAAALAYARRRRAA